jgi:hypothetical protein
MLGFSIRRNKPATRGKNGLKAMSNEQIEKRIEELTGRIPVGTECDDTNNCGGFLTPAEEAELNELFRLQAEAV